MTKSMPGKFYENINGVDVYYTHEIDNESFVPQIRFYHIKKDGSRQFFKCRYDYQITPQPVENLAAENELKRIIKEELTAEIDNARIS